MRPAIAWLFATVAVVAARPVSAVEFALGPATAREHFVAVETIARGLGWAFHATYNGAIVNDGNGPETVHIGSRSVTEDGVAVPLFAHPATVQRGQVALEMNDAAALFHMQIVRRDAGLVLIAESPSESTIREIPRPATPSPRPSPAARADARTAPVVRGNAGVLDVSVVFDGNERIFNTTATGTAGEVRGALSSYGTDAFAKPAGFITVGKAAQNITFGPINNPLSGSVIVNGALAGFDAHVARGPSAFDAVSGYGVQGRILALERTSANTTDVLAAVPTASNMQLLLQHSVNVAQRWGTIEAESLLGSAGAGAGMHVRTRGKTFVDAVASFAVGTLPLSDGDLPTGAVIGEKLSSATTVTAGYIRSIDAPASPTIGVSTRLNAFALGMNVSRHWTNLTTSYGGRSGYGLLFASFGIQRVIGANVGIDVHRAFATLDVNSSAGNTSGVAQVRTAGPGINLALGAYLNGGLLRPLAGVVWPLTPAIALETAIVPAPSGHPALRLSILAGFRRTREKRTTFPVAFRVADAARYGPLQLFIDGVRVGKAYLAGSPVRIPAGTHAAFIQSSDRIYGSQTQFFTTVSGATIDVTLVPQRTVEGIVQFGGARNAIAGDATLEAIRVVLEPSGESTTTDANGHFMFPWGPYDPASTILLDPASLPNGITDSEAQPLAAGVTRIVLVPARQTERALFR